MWNYLNKLAISVTLLTAMAGVIWYFVALEERIASLETQLNTLGGGISVITSHTNHNGDELIDPITARCDKLAEHAAKAHNNYSTSTAERLESLMNRLGCFKQP